MKIKILFLLFCITFPLTGSAQASGGQIRRVENRKHKNKDTTTPTPNQIETYEVNGVSFSMVQVDGGTFTMGVSKDRAEWTGNRDAYPPHKVTLSSYKMSTTEVTYELWEAVMGSKHYNQKSKGGEKMPVEATWKYSFIFLNKLSEILGKTFRFPTEAEWEFAAKGGTRSRGYKYPGSNNAREVAWIWDNSGHEVHEVGKKKPNELGLYDMCGNVDEWCYDWYAPYNSGGEIDPHGPESGEYHVCRGGDISSGDNVILPEFRSRREENHMIGFRIVLSDNIIPGYDILSASMKTNSIKPTIQPISIDKLCHYNVVVCTFSLLSNAQAECQKLRDDSFFSEIFLDSSNMYRVLMFKTSNSEEDALLYRNKAREKYPAAWIMCVENGRTYKYDK